MPRHPCIYFLSYRGNKRYIQERPENPERGKILAECTETIESAEVRSIDEADMHGFLQG